MINLLLFLIGISVCSFLNVLIDRLPKGKSPFKGRSHCDFCRKTLAWYDLIPVVSFLVSQRKCRYCHKNLSFQYPFIELVTGLLFILTYNIFHSSGIFILAGNLISISGLIVLFMMDLKYGVLADEIVFPLIAISLIILIYQYMIISFFPIIIVQSFLIAALVSAFFFIIAIITKGKGMGGGDIKLSFLMGLVLGLPGIIIALYLAFISCGLVASVLLLLRKKHFGQTIPFGPFLALATIVTIFYGDQIWLWYTRKFLGG